MKNRIKFLLCYAGVIIFIFGCAGSKNTTAETPQLQPKLQSQLQPEQIQAEDNYRIWRQSNFRQIRVGDPISFFNNSEIVLYGTFMEEVFKLIDGKVRKETIPKYVTKTVPIRTPGRLISMKKTASGIIHEMEIEFSSKDETFLFTFILAVDDSFILYGNAPLIFEGTEYKTTAVVAKTCQLLWDFTEDVKPQYIYGKAEGVRIRGERTITIK